MGFDHFSWLAPFYDRIFDSKGREQLYSLLALPTEGRLLDAGGGTGRIAASMQGEAGQLIVTDLSTGMLQQAGQKECLDPLQTHVEFLPFPQNSFDRIVVVDAFHHFCDQRDSAAELWRVLAPGGRLVIEEPNVETWTVKLLAVAEKVALMRSHFYGPEAIKDMFRQIAPQATVEVHRDEEYTAWVVVQK
jgi:demethylmenaquinone methyltransferase/2-methoxy-6-polyprenyl-1,4-benzoquinol methylase